MSQLRSLNSNSRPSYGITAEPVLSLTSTLECFLGGILKTEVQPILATSFKQFDAIRKKISNATNLLEASERTLQSTCLSDLKKYGENTLENTSDSIFGQSDRKKNSAAEFRKLNFASRFEDSKRPDLTLRLSVDGDIDRKRFPPDLILPSWRLCPWAVIAYIDIKKWNTDVSKCIQQALYYAQSTLLCCPGRTYCVTAVYNFRSVIFCAVICSEGNLSYFRSKVVLDAEASREIAKFLSCDRSILGFVDSYRFGQVYHPVAVLGRGSTALCISIRHPPENHSKDKMLALKVSRDGGELATERAILTYLHSCDAALKIPTIPPTAPHILESIFGDAYCPTATVLSPVYVERKQRYLDETQLLNAWKGLHQIHRFGICHRDVRLPNIGACGKTLHWMDWSSGKPYRLIEALENSRVYQGSTCTASIPVLKRMRLNSQDYDCFPSDEAISMIYLSFICVIKETTLEVPRSPDNAILNWEHQIPFFPAKTIEAISALEAIPTAQHWDEDTLSIIDEHVKSAIQALFEKYRQKLTSEGAAPAAQKKRQSPSSTPAKTKRNKVETRAAAPSVESPDVATPKKKTRAAAVPKGAGRGRGVHRQLQQRRK
jgi:hypothetical protein